MAGEDLSNNIPDAKSILPSQESKERVLPTPLPRIDQFPGKIRPVIKKAFEEGTAKSNTVFSLMDGLSGVKTKLDVLDQEKEGILRQSEEVSSEGKKQAEETFSAVVSEIRFLQQARIRLSQGKDVPELRNTKSPFTPPEGDDYKSPTIEFTDEELKKFGSEGGILDRGRRIIAGMRENQYQKSEGFRMKMERLFGGRFGILLRYGLSPQDFWPDLELNSKFNRDDFPKGTTPLEEQSVHMEQTLDRLSSTLKTTAPNIATSTYFSNLVREWVNQNKDQLTTNHGRTFEEHLTDRLNTNDTILARDLKTWRSWVQSGGKGLTSWYQQRIHDKIYEVVCEIGDIAFPVKKAHAPGLSTASFSQEYLDLLVRLKARVEEVMEKAGDFSIERLTGKIGIGEYQSKFDQELGVSKDLLFHVAPYEKFKDILRRGTLASRQYQIDQFGESNFHSGGVKVGSDYVDVADYYGYPKRMTKEEYTEYIRRRSGMAKEPDQEAHQICFSESGPYMYYQGVGFVFSKSSLFSNSQFMESDGWHLFPDNFNGDNKKTPGYSVDVAKEPLVIIVSQDLRDDFREFVQTELAKIPSWGITDVDEWMDNHTFVVPANTSNEFTMDMVDEIKNKFWKNNQVDKKVGWIVPTGEQGQTADRNLMPLFGYKQAA